MELYYSIINYHQNCLNNRRIMIINHEIQAPVQIKDSKPLIHFSLRPRR